jgi:DNA-binding CsgD family transcriptional regulator
MPAISYGKRLSPAEVRVLEISMLGYTIPRIAKHLGRAENTVKSQLRDAMQKLGAPNRLAAVLIALDAGYITPRRVNEAHPPRMRWVIEVQSTSGMWRTVDIDGSPFPVRDVAKQTMDDLRLKRPTKTFRVIRAVTSFTAEEEANGD